MCINHTPPWLHITEPFKAQIEAETKAESEIEKRKKQNKTKCVGKQ